MDEENTVALETPSEVTADVRLSVGELVPYRDAQIAVHSEPRPSLVPTVAQSPKRSPFARFLAVVAPIAALVADVVLTRAFAVSVVSHLALSSILLLGVGPFQQTQSAPSTYVGPGDIVAGAKAFWATYSCYNSAYVGNVMSVWDAATGSTLHTLVTCSSGGVINETITPLATTCATACEVETLYDQSGALACAGSTACNLTATHASALRPPLTLSALNTAPCIPSASAVKTLTSANNFTLAQPFTAVNVMKRISGSADVYAVIRDAGSSAGTIRVGYKNAVNQVAMFNGSSAPGVTASDGSFHDLSYVFANATQSVIYVDGASTNVSLGASTGFAGTAGVALFEAGANTTSVNACESGIWGSDIGSTAASSLSTNARTRYGSF